MMKLLVFLFYALTFGKESNFAFLKVPFNAKVTALCENVVAFINEPSAFVYNPALLATSDKTAFIGNYIFHFTGIHSANLTFASGFRKSGVGIDLRYFYIADELIDIYLTKVGDIRHFYGVLTGGFGLNLHEFIAGVNLKYAFQNIAFTKEVNSNAILFDIGLLKVNKKHAIGFSIKNITDRIEDMPYMVTLGGYTEMKGYTMFGSVFKQANRPIGISGSIIWEVFVFDLLAGVKYELPKTVKFAMGLCYKYKLTEIQYAFFPIWDLGISHRVSIKISL